MNKPDHFNGTGTRNLGSVIELLPDKPGVYEFYDEKGTLLYVGKAKNLKKRVASYFSRQNHQNNKIRLLVRKIHDIRHILVDSESDALLLENNMIKKYQPRYNVQLKDDKTFPWICIKNEPFPRIFITRNIKTDGSVYYGPYTSVVMVRILLDLIRQLLPLRTCGYQLNSDNIQAGKFKVCLEYHIGNCLAPCVGKQSQQEYDESVSQVHQILKGNVKQVVMYLKGLMQRHSGSYQYEQAQLIKEKIQTLKRYQSRSTIVNPRLNDIDVYSIIEEEQHAYVNYLKVMNGAVIQAHNLEIRKQLDECKEDLLPMAIVEIRSRINSNAREIIIPFLIDIQIQHGLRFTVPLRGDKKKLLALSQRNVRQYMMEQHKQRDAASGGNRHVRILEKMKSDLRLTGLPKHIEAFDISNIQGKLAVASCVVFRNAKPSKKEYRHFHIKTVSGANDFASIEEVISRRYSRMIRESREIPQLVVIDGGKGQLNAAVRSLELLGLRGRLAVIGIAKRLEEIFFPDDPVPLYIDKGSETLKMIQSLRNEAHRFGISFHRKQRTKSMTRSVLDQIDGIGEQTRQKLLAKYHSIDRILSEEPEILYKEIGRKKTDYLLSYFRNKSE